MTFSEICLRGVQIGLHLLWFLAPIYFYDNGVTARRRGEEFDITVYDLLFWISYGSLIVGYLNGWNVKE